MRSIGTLTLVGHLGSEPRLSQTPTGKQVMEISLAINKGPKDQQKTTWIKATIWTPTWQLKDGDEGLHKGTYVNVSGDVEPDQYVGKDGVKHDGLRIGSARVSVLAPAGAGRSVAPTEPSGDEGAYSAAAAAPTLLENDDLPF